MKLYKQYKQTSNTSNKATQATQSTQATQATQSTQSTQATRRVVCKRSLLIYYIYKMGKYSVGSCGNFFKAFFFNFAVFLPLMCLCLSQGSV